MQYELRSLRSMRTMPLPDRPVVEQHGWNQVGVDHYIHLFPAVIREQATVQAQVSLQSGESTCFFHPQLPATALCDVSGRMICDLCKTDWQGQTVSFEALQTLLSKDGQVKKEQACTKWDDIALGLVIFPWLFAPIMVLTAPTALGICIFKWRAGPTSVVRRSRWRYVVAAVLALLEIGFGILMIIAMTSGGDF